MVTDSGLDRNTMTLLAAGGRYAERFELQAAGYR